ncbi:MAG TPA: NAD(P)-binding domain-containing protein [Fimbriimonas sp.]
MRIAIIGSGQVGGTLAKTWARSGHQVTFGSRDPSSEHVAALLQECGDACSATNYREAAQWAEVIALATPWASTQAAINAMGNLAGKIILDATNPVKEDLSGLEVEGPSSGGQLVAQWASGAKVVKIFNSTGSANMALPLYGGEALTLLYCGDDADAKRVAEQLANEVGFDPIDAGPLSNAHLLEALALLWITLAVKQGYGTDFAFNFLKRPKRAFAHVR